MKRLSSFLKYYFILVVPFVSCDDFPLKDIDIDESSGFTCCAPDKIMHNLDLLSSITNNLNRICWRKDSSNKNEFYLISVLAETPTEGTAIDVPFEGSQAQVIFFNNGKFEFKVFGMTATTWHIVCEFSQARLSRAKVLFNAIYADDGRSNVALEDFATIRIRKHPNLSSTGPAFSWGTFIYRETGHENTTFTFTTGDGHLTDPILIFSNADFHITQVDLMAKTVSLRVFNDKHPYVFYFYSTSATEKFAECFWQFALHCEENNFLFPNPP